jgi:hypothetical protein
MLANDPAVVEWLETVEFTRGQYNQVRENAPLYLSPNAKKAVEQARQEYVDALARDVRRNGGWNGSWPW